MCFREVHQGIRGPARVQQVRGDHSIEGERRRRQPGPLQNDHGPLGVVRGFRDCWGLKQSADVVQIGLECVRLVGIRLRAHSVVCKQIPRPIGLRLAQLHIVCDFGGGRKGDAAQMGANQGTGCDFRAHCGRAGAFYGVDRFRKFARGADRYQYRIEGVFGSRSLHRRPLRTWYSREQTLKLILCEQVAEPLPVLRRGAVGLDGKVQRRIADDRGEPLGEDRLSEVCLQRGASFRGRDFGHVLEQIFDRVPALKQRRGGLFTYPRHAGNIVGGIANERLPVRDAVRPDTVPRAHRFGVVKLYFGNAAQGHLNRNAVAHELELVRIAGQNRDDVSLFDATAGEGTDQIVSLVARKLRRLDSHGLHESPCLGHLGAKLRIDVRPVGFIAFELLAAKRLLGAVPADHEGVWLFSAHQREEHIRKSEQRACRSVVRGRQVPACEEGAEEQAISVHQQELFGRDCGGGGFGHAGGVL